MTLHLDQQACGMLAAVNVITVSGMQMLSSRLYAWSGFSWVSSQLLLEPGQVASWPLEATDVNILVEYTPYTLH
jgi:hypothetical protein